MTADLTLPESLQLYLSDQGVRSAVAQLDDEEGFLRDLNTGDLPNYYRARLAMRHLLADWGMFGHQLWQATWGEALADGTPWEPLSLAELIDDEAEWAVTEDTLRLDDDLAAGWASWIEDDRCFYSKLILKPDSSVCIAFDIDTYGKEKIAAPHLTSCSFTRDKDGRLFLSGPIVRIVDGRLHTEEIRAACAETAVSVATWIMTQRPRPGRRTTELQRAGKSL